MKLTIFDRLLLALALTATIGTLLYTFSQSQTAYGSVGVSSEYIATTTSQLQGTNNPVRTMRNGQGTLGSIVVTGPNSGTIQIYDATTSDITQRAASMGSTTVLLAEIPSQGTASSTATYTFDVLFTRGLLIVTTGTAPTTTVTWR